MSLAANWEHVRHEQLVDSLGILRAGGSNAAMHPETILVEIAIIQP